MTKYINKATGAELDYDKVHEDFECSLTWNGDCDPEEFLIYAYEDDFEDWLVSHGIEEIELPDPPRPKKTAKRKANKKAKSRKVTAVCDDTISSFIQMFQEWHERECNAQELMRITLEVSKSLEDHPQLVEETIALYGNEESAYYEEVYQALTDIEKRCAFALDLLLTEGMKS